MARDDPNQLSPDDARILSVESDVITGHTLKLVVLEPGRVPLDIDALRTAVSQRLPSQPRASQRVDTSGPEPHWVDSPDFDINDHVRAHPTPKCVSREDLWRPST